jgi:hypothetical protein
LADTAFFRFPSFPFLPFRSKMPFTAFRAHKLATINAHKFCQGKTDAEPCPTCKGTGETSMTISTLGSSAAPSVTTIPCMTCMGKKSVSPVAAAYKKLIWCGCRHKHEPSFQLAPDGARVFGNKDTYLCGFCGFVRQFG